MQFTTGFYCSERLYRSKMGENQLTGPIKSFQAGNIMVNDSDAMNQNRKQDKNIFYDRCVFCA